MELENQEIPKMHDSIFESHILESMNSLKIDPELTARRLNELNSGKYDNVKPLEVKEFPFIDGESVIKIDEEGNYVFDYDTAKKRIDELNLNININNYSRLENDKIILSFNQLKRLGIALAPVISYGILNGGSASSYVDKKKNKNSFGKLFNIYEKYFSKLSSLTKSRPKGLTLAYLNKDGSVGEPFFKLKLRALLIKTFEYMILHNKSEVQNPYQVFQMDSVLNSEEISQALKEYETDPILKELIDVTGHNITNVYTGTQPLMAAFTHKGKPYGVFTNSETKDNSLIAMPGGHGHNFEVLKEVYEKLHAEGKRFAYLTNVDNLANTVNDAAVAYMALSGKQAGFEFSTKTDVDTKGGVAIIDQKGNLNCGDIGVAISYDKIQEAEAMGKTILFNTAIGLFNLNYLLSEIDNIIENLPVRHSIQDKDIGKYSQIEQVTWEVLGMIQKPVIFAVDKYDRFLAGKTLIESLMASGIDLDHPEYPEEFNKIAGSMSISLRKKMETEFGMKQVHNRWIPKSIDKLKSEILEKNNQNGNSQ